MNCNSDSRHATSGISTCRVIIADDHPVVLTGLQQVLRVNPDIEIVGTAQTISGMMSMLSDSSCDILLCDYAFDGDAQPDGLALLKRIRHAYPELKVVLLSAHHDLVTVKYALNLGVQGFLRKSTETINVVQAIRAVHSNRRYTDPVTSEELLDDMLGSRQPDFSAVTLSARETETMRLLKKGMRVSEIALMTHRSVKTVSAQKNALMRKLGVKSDMELFKILTHFL